MSSGLQKTSFLKKARPILVLIFLTLLILLVDSFFFHFIFPVKKQKILTNLNQNVVQSLEQKPPTDALEPIPFLEFQKVTKRCLDHSWSSFNDFPGDYIKQHPIKSKTTEIENFHLKTSDKKTLRLHILNESTKRLVEVYLFELDAQGQLLPIPLSVSQRNLKPSELIKELKSLGEAFHHETKERWQLENGHVLVITFINNTVKDFQLFTDSKTFSCEQDQCFCF